jgi:hypothetical protein
MDTSIAIAETGRAGQQRLLFRDGITANETPRSLLHFVDILHIYAKYPDYRAPYAVCKV